MIQATGRDLGQPAPVTTRLPTDGCSLPIKSATARAMMFVMSCSLVAECGLIRPSISVDYDDQRLNGGRQGLVQHGNSARWSDFTAWSWDDVHLSVSSTNGN